MLGLLVGDALGVPYEFHSWDQIPAPGLIEFDPPPGYARAHGGVPPGTFSDDGAHALCLLASLLHNGRLDIEDLARRLINWFDHGYLAVDNRVFDIGIQTRKALEQFRAGDPAAVSGPAGEMDNGNGSLMRVLPLALWHRGSNAELVRDAAEQSKVTHGHSRSQICCALYCLWVRRTLDGGSWEQALADWRALYPAGTPERKELEKNIRPDDDARVSGSGYVVDCLHSARFAVSKGNYEQAVKAAIMLGNDTDTTAAVAGGLAGARDGVQAIPSRWRDSLRGKELYQPLLEQLLAL
jgi:ADP-ribosyl-[dinitrogen reductase] hydrolase